MAPRSARGAANLGANSTARVNAVRAGSKSSCSASVTPRPCQARKSLGSFWLAASKRATAASPLPSKRPSSPSTRPSSTESGYFCRATSTMLRAPAVSPLSRAARAWYAGNLSSPEKRFWPSSKRRVTRDMSPASSAKSADMSQAPAGTPVVPLIALEINASVASRASLMRWLARASRMLWAWGFWAKSGYLSKSKRTALTHCTRSLALVNTVLMGAMPLRTVACSLGPTDTSPKSLETATSPLNTDTRVSPLSPTLTSQSVPLIPMVAVGVLTERRRSLLIKPVVARSKPTVNCFAWAHMRPLVSSRLVPPSPSPASLIRKVLN